jgi:hypothetical protein
MRLLRTNGKRPRMKLAVVTAGPEALFTETAGGIVKRL